MIPIAERRADMLTVLIREAASFDLETGEGIEPAADRALSLRPAARRAGLRPGCEPERRAIGSRAHGPGFYALNFFSPAFVDQLKRGRKTATIRLGDKSRKYERGQLVWITVGHQHSPREKIFTAVIDDVEVKRARDLSPRDIEHDNPEFRRLEETLGFMRQIYGREIDPEETVTVVRFSQVIETPHGAQFGNGETPSRN